MGFFLVARPFPYVIECLAAAVAASVRRLVCVLDYDVGLQLGSVGKALTASLALMGVLLGPRHNRGQN